MTEEREASTVQTQNSIKEMMQMSHFTQEFQWIYVLYLREIRFASKLL